MSMLDDLDQMCDTAQSCEGLAREAIGYAMAHTFSTDEWCADRQARVLRRYINLTFGRLEERRLPWEHIDNLVDVLDCIKTAVNSRIQPFRVADTIYTTAHEAAIGYADAALLAWNSMEGITDREKCEDLQRRLQGIECPELHFQIEWERDNARELLGAEAEGLGEGSGTSSTRAAKTESGGKGKGGRNLKWENLYDLICSDEMKNKSDEEIAATYRQRYSRRKDSGLVDADKVKQVRYDYGKRSRK